MTCNGDYGTALGQAYLNKVTICEENCSWRSSSTICYPGTCPDGENSCTCTSGFTGTDCRTLTSSQTPIMNYCLTKLHDTSGGTLELQCVDNGHTSYVRITNLTNFENDWKSNYYQPAVAFPPYISSFALGMIRGITVATIYNKAGTSTKEVARLACSDLANQNVPRQSLYHCIGTDGLDLSGWAFATGDRIRVVVEVENGGYVTVEDRDTNSASKRYYTGRTLTRTGNYVFDFDRPVHCSIATSCTLEIFNCGNDITKQNQLHSFMGNEDVDFIQWIGQNANYNSTKQHQNQ
ncbi:uncharacterized protein LOC117122906 [Anneissia japonica]|uniref:uncharacterized protein LOC117122906 n=1 Tax=Anneissia japonica TaxID=1529436 RepID=UPI0014257299|nr:uncharacterized protein LOC117122906 [Anneissia japonica]